MRYDYSEAMTIWLNNNEPKGNCYEASLFMKLAFPELRLVRGHYGGRPHWWNLAPTGEIIDVTIGQFDFIRDYVPFSGGEPSGKCHNCGELVYVPGTYFCCEACESEMLKLLGA